MRLIKFFRQIPEFDQLTTEDKTILVKHNIMQLVPIDSTLSPEASRNPPIGTDDEMPWNSAAFQQIQGQEIVMGIKKMLESFRNLARFDQKIVRLALVILIFTESFTPDAQTSGTILKDGLAVYRAQSYYSDLLWKYMQAQHGSNIATQIFCEIVFRCISWHTLNPKVRQNVRHVALSAAADELTPLMKSLLNLT